MCSIHTTCIATYMPATHMQHTMHATHHTCNIPYMLYHATCTQHASNIDAIKKMSYMHVTIHANIHRIHGNDISDPRGIRARSMRHTCNIHALHVVCCMLHVACMSHSCYMLHVACCMLHACRMHDACMSHGCCMYDMQHACNLHGDTLLCSSPSCWLCRR